MKLSLKKICFAFLSFLILNVGWSQSNSFRFLDISYWLLGISIFTLIWFVSIIDKKIYNLLNKKHKIEVNKASVIIFYYALNFLCCLLIIVIGLTIFFELPISDELENNTSFEVSIASIILISFVISTVFLYSKFRIELNKNKKIEQNSEHLFFQVMRNNKTINISAKDVSYFFLDNTIVNLTKTSGEVFSIRETLTQIKNQNKNNNLFSVNRQYLVTKHAIKSWQRTHTRKLLIEIIPKTNQEVTVSKNRSSEFIKWIQT